MHSTEPNPAAAAPATPETRANASRERRVPQMSPAEFWGCVALLLGIFLFAAGPVWRHPFNVDASAIYSYIPIPFLVALVLAIRRKLTLAGFFLDTVKLTLTKFGVTWALATCLWALNGAPPVRARVPPLSTSSAAVAPLPPPTPLPPEKIGRIEGIVRDARGTPVAGALVAIEAGLDGYVFAPRTTPLRLEVGRDGLVPNLAGAQAHAPIEVRSTDGHLHTLVATTQRDATLFNVPLPAAGGWSTAIPRSTGWATIRCNVHQGAAAEQGTLEVLHHPFFTTTDSSGRFSLVGVPAERVRVAAHGVSPSRAATREVVVPASEVAKVDLDLSQIDSPPP